MGICTRVAQERSLDVGPQRIFTFEWDPARTRQHAGERNDIHQVRDSSRQCGVAARPGACNPAKDAKPGDEASTGPAAETVNGTAISQRTVDAIAKQGASSGRPDTTELRKANSVPP
jgi:hypothetical protein